MYFWVKLKYRSSLDVITNEDKRFRSVFEKNNRVTCMHRRKQSFSFPGISCAFTISSESTLLSNIRFRMIPLRTCRLPNIKRASYIFKNSNYEITLVVCVHLCVDSLTPRLIPFICSFTPFPTLNYQPHFLSDICPCESYGLTCNIFLSINN